MASSSGIPKAGMVQSDGAILAWLFDSSFSESGMAVSGRSVDSSVGNSSCASTFDAFEQTSGGSADRAASTPSSDQIAIRASAGWRE